VAKTAPMKEEISVVAAVFVAVVAVAAVVEVAVDAAGVAALVCGAA